MPEEINEFWANMTLESIENKLGYPVDDEGDFKPDFK